MKNVKDFNTFLNENIDTPKNIRIGNDYKTKYLNKTSYEVEEIEVKNNDKIEKQYKITNKPNAQIFKGVLSVMKDGSAIMDVNYTSYSNVKNKYKNYFDKDGNEIIHKDNKTRYEKEFYDKITNESV